MASPQRIAPFWHEDFAASEKELVDTVDSLARASQVLKKNLDEPDACSMLVVGTEGGQAKGRPE